MNLWGMQGSTAQRDWCAFVVCELCQKHSVLYYNVFLFWFIKNTYTEVFCYMMKHVYGITKTVSYMVHLIWYMEIKTCTKYCLYEKNMYR